MTTSDLAARKQAIRDGLAAADAELSAHVDSLPPGDDERRTATADGWTIRDTLSHLAGGERGNLFIAQSIRDGRAIYNPDFDLARYNRRNIEKAAGKTSTEFLADYRAARADVLAFLDTLTEDDLNRAGRRTTGEDSTVEEVFYRLISHEREHTAEIREALKSEE